MVVLKNCGCNQFQLQKMSSSNKVAMQITVKTPDFALIKIYELYYKISSLFRLCIRLNTRYMFKKIY